MSVNSAIMRVLLELQGKGYLREAKEVDKANVRMGDSSTRAAKGIDSTGTSAKRTEVILKGLKTTLVAVSIAVAAALGSGVSTATDYGSELTKINTLVGVQSDLVSKWRRDLLGLAPAIGKGPTELAKAMFVVTSAGQKGAGALETVEQAGKAAASGLGETATIARVVTAAMKAYESSGLDAGTATAQLIGTVREGNLEASQLAGSLGRVIGITAQAGVSFGELGGFIATFTKLGVDSNEAVTSLRGLLTSLIKPSQGAVDALAGVGRTVDDLRIGIREDGLAATLVNLVELFDGNTEALAQVIPNVRALSGVLGTAAAQGKDFLEIEKAVASTTADLVETIFAASGLDPKERFNALAAGFESLRILIGDSLTQALGEAALNFTNFLTERQDQFAAFGSAVGTAAGTALDGIALLAKGADSVAIAFTALIGLGIVRYLQATAGASRLAAVATLDLRTAVWAVQSGYARLVVLDVAAKLKAWTIAMRGFLLAAGGLALVVAGAVALNEAFKGASERLGSEIASIVQDSAGIRDVWDQVGESMESASIEGVNQQISTMSARLGPVLTRISDIKTQMAELQAQGTSGGKSQLELDTQLQALRISLGEANAESLTLSKGIGQLVEHVGELEEAQRRAAQVAREEFLAALKEQTQALRDQLAALGRSQDAYEEQKLEQEAIRKIRLASLEITEALVEATVRELRTQRDLNATIENRKKILEAIAKAQDLPAGIRPRLGLEEVPLIDYDRERERLKWHEKQAEKLNEELEKSAKATIRVRKETDLWAEHFGSFVDGVQSAWADTLYDIFTGSFEGFDDLFKQILQMFLRMLAEMAAAAAAAKLSETLFDGVGGAASGGGGGFLAGLGKLFGVGEGAAGLGLLAVPAAIWAIGDMISDRRNGRIFDFGAGSTFSNGSLGFSTVDPAGQAGEITGALQELMGEVMGILGDSVTELGGITILARRDGKGFRASVAGELVGIFDTAQEAIQAAAVAAFSSATVDDPHLQTALRASADLTAEQLITNLETAIRLRDGHLTQAARDFGARLGDEVADALDFALDRVVRAGFSSSDATGEVARVFERFRNDLLGITEDNTVPQSLDQFSRQLEAAIRQLEDDLARSLRLLESDAQENAGLAAAIGGLFTDSGEILGEGIASLGQEIQTVVNDVTAGLGDRIAFITAELERLRALRLTEEDRAQALSQGSGGGGRRRSRIQALQQAITNAINGTQQAVSSAIGRLVDSYQTIRDEARALGQEGSRSAQALASLREQIRETLEIPIRQALAAAGVTAALLTTPLPVAGATQYAQLELQLRGVVEQTEDWTAALEQAREELGESPIDPALLEAGISAAFTQVGENAIDSLGLPMEQLKDRVGAIVGTIQFLQDNQEALNLSAGRFGEIVRQVGEQAFSSLAGGLLDLIGDEEQFTEHRRFLQRMLFDARVKQYRIEFELLAAQGLFTRQQMAMMEELFGFLDENIDRIFEDQFNGANTPAPIGGGFGNVSVPTLPIDPFGDAQSFLDQLAQLENQGSGQSPIEAITSQMDSLRDRANEIRGAFIRFGTSLDEVLDRIEAVEAAQIAEVFRQALAPLESIQDQLAFGGLSGANPRETFDRLFGDAQRLLGEASSSNPDNEARLAAIQQLHTLIPQLLSAAPNILAPTALGQFQDFIQNALGAITGYDPFGSLSGGAGGGGGGLGIGVDPPGGGGGGIYPGRGGFDALAGLVPAVSTGQAAVVAEVARLNDKVDRLTNLLAGVHQSVDARRDEAADQADIASRERQGIADEAAGTTSEVQRLRRRPPGGIRAEATR